MTLKMQQHKGLDVIPCRVNGEVTPFDPERLFEVTSAAQQKVVHYGQSATVEVAETAVNSAIKTFKQWSETPYQERRAVLMKAADVLESRVEELARYQIDETSCPEMWARFNVILAAKAVREIAASISTACAGHMPVPETGHTFCLVFKQPVGPVLSMAPWNGSVILSSRTLSAPLAAGCTVVFKASELCPQTHQGVVQAFLDAGVPHGAINQIQVRREDAAKVTETIIANPGIRKMEFIGSATVGKAIGQIAMKYMKPVLMELGGKNAAIVLKDANLQRAAMLCVQGSVMHHGQVCMSTDKIIVEKAVAEPFIEKLKEVTRSLNGNAGFAVTKAMAQKAQKTIADSLTAGATLVTGSNRLNGAEAALEPTFITNVKSDSPLNDNETFGPSASIHIVSDEHEAVAVANNTSYGLTGAVHTTDVLKGIRVAKQMDVGVIAINGLTLWEEPAVPMGGMKGSGWGKNNSRFAIEEFLVEKAIAVIDPSAGPEFGSA
jgi:acyl-CoA reductase-like NAD-dependent aldehyde dehydrogenase